MDEIADLADVGKGTLYRYFETKEDLFMAVLSYALDLATERLRAELHEMDDPVAQLEATCRQALRFFRRNGHLYRMLHHEKAFRCSSGRADIEEKLNRLRHFVEHILLGGAKRGVFEVEDAGFASAMLWGMVRTTLRSMPAEEPLDELSRRVAGLFTKGLLARGPSGP
jgi:AcrR family transcriptional regulator